MPKKRTIPILFLFLCTCGIDHDAGPATSDGLTTAYEALTGAERAVIDHERATANDWAPVHEAFAHAVRASRAAGQ